MNHNSIEYTKGKKEIYANIYLRESIGLPDGVYIDDMLLVTEINQYVNM